MPGAFPNKRTVFFFDWDDTLCPTTWIRRILKDHIADSQQWAEDFTGTCEVDWLDSIPAWFTQPLPDEPSFHESIADLQQAVIETIDLAQVFGVVCIVTNAVPGWVEKTIKKWLPKLTPYISGHGFQPPIRVLYGQQHYAELTDENELPPVNDRGPLMWWKKGAMQLALDEVEQLYRLERGGPSDPVSWCTSGQSKLVDTVVSVGDNEAEMEASELCGCMCNARRLQRVEARHAGREVQRRATSAPPRDCSRPHNPWVKLVKLKEWPHVRTLCMQLEEMHEILPYLVSMRKHFRVDLARQDPLSPLGHPRQDPTSPLMPRSSADLRSHLLCAESEAELRMDHSLRTQTV